MDIVRKTTILFPDDLYRRLTRLARQRKTSVGHLVRSACQTQYGRVTMAERMKAVEELAKLSLPVGTPAELKRQSVPDPSELMPS